MNPLSLYLSVAEDVAFNLALEEYLLLHETKDILLIYRNTDAVVIGKHQNPWKEVHLPYCKEMDIPVVRRLSGGGTVYHDLNNINFSFIRSKAQDFVDFKEHIRPISAALHSCGVEHHISDRNDLFIRDHKISGNAEHVSNKNKRILHHGTLLYNSDLNKLKKAIHSEVQGIQTHAVDSVRSPVTCIQDHCELEGIQAFLDSWLDQLQVELSLTETVLIDPRKVDTVQELVRDKFNQWNWNFGHSPQFDFTTSKGDVVTVRKGIITRINWANHEAFPDVFIDKPFQKKALKQLLKDELHPLVDRICID